MGYIKEVYAFIYENFYITIEFTLSESYTYNVILKMRMFFIYYILNLFLLESYELTILEITVCLQSKKMQAYI